MYIGALIKRAEPSSIEVVAGPSTVHGSDKVMSDTIDKYNPNNDNYEKVICANDTSELYPHVMLI